MCKRINRFIPVLFVSSIVLTILAGAVIAVTGVNIPLWGSYLISQAIVLLPALVYVAVHKINIIACMPYRKLRISDGLLSLLIGYTLIPLMLFINSVSGLFSTNYVQGSVQELVAYPFWLQLLIIAFEYQSVKLCGGNGNYICTACRGYRLYVFFNAGTFCSEFLFGDSDAAGVNDIRRQ